MVLLADEEELEEEEEEEEEEEDEEEDEDHEDEARSGPQHTTQCSRKSSALTPGGSAAPQAEGQ